MMTLMISKLQTAHPAYIRGFTANVIAHREVDSAEVLQALRTSWKRDADLTVREASRVAFMRVVPGDQLKVIKK